MPWSDTFGVVGLGRMARALLLPLLDSGLVARSAVRASVATEASARRLADELGLQVATESAQAWSASVVLLAVKPQQIEAVASAATAALAAAEAAIEAAPPGREPLLISVLAGVPLRRLQALFPGRACVRAVPNTPALVRAGLTGLSWGEGVGEGRRAEVRQLFAQVGEVLELPEPQLDPFLALTSSGPAFLALVSESMADGAVAAGLPRPLARHLAHRTMAGTAALLQG